MRSKLIALIAIVLTGSGNAMVVAQRIQFPTTGLRPIDGTTAPSTLAPPPGSTGPVMVPINPATQSGLYPSTGVASPSFDPYGGTTASSPPALTGVLPGLPQATSTAGSFPGYTGPQPSMPGTGQSAIVGTFPNTAPNYNVPGVYPNSTPSALFPGTYPNQNPGGTFGGWFGGLYNDMFGGPGVSYGGYTQPGVVPPNGSIYPPGYNNGASTWNPQGSVFNGGPGYPQFVRFFQGPRFRHAFLHGDDDADALMINDSDLSLAFAIPNFLYSTQPLYLLPSFSLHNWDGPHPMSTADLPAIAYSAFLDTGWQSDPARILGAELGLRVGMFSDFNTATSDSLRIMGRGIGRIRVTPQATLKLGVMYLDRNRIKLLPAGGLLWQPNADTRFDLFFPEPKLAHYLSTIGTRDVWWYVGGYYGGGAWTIERAAGGSDSIDINDLRVVLGLEWGRNEQMREGRRFGFVEVGYVFERELLYQASPMDNLDLQDTFMIRAGLGY